jgi:hypothetical protein
VEPGAVQAKEPCQEQSAGRQGAAACTLHVARMQAA